MAKIHFADKKYGINTYKLLRVETVILGSKDKTIYGFRCLKCGFTSWNQDDIKFLYCGNCHTYHTQQNVPVLDIPAGKAGLAAV